MSVRSKCCVKCLITEMIVLLETNQTFLISHVTMVLVFMICSKSLYETNINVKAQQCKSIVFYRANYGLWLNTHNTFQTITTQTHSI